MSRDACRTLHASLHGVLLTGQQLLWTSQHASGLLVPCVRVPETDFTEGVSIIVANGWQACIVPSSVTQQKRDTSPGRV